MVLVVTVFVAMMAYKGGDKSTDNGDFDVMFVVVMVVHYGSDGDDDDDHDGDDDDDRK